MTVQIGRPVRRRMVLVGAVVAGLVIAGIVAGTEALRYPHPTSAAVTAPEARPEPAADPREPLECEDPLPREGQERDEDVTGDQMARVSSSELYDCPETYDGRRVRYRGEVIGAVLWRNEGAWVHLNDDIYATDSGPLPAHRDFRGGNGGLGVFVPRELAAQITHVGGPTERGDVIDVIGTFHRVDRATGEVAIMRASDGTRRPGEPLERPLLPARRTVAIVMACLMLAVVGLERRFRRAP